MNEHSAQPRLVLATANPGKLREFRSLLPAAIELLWATDLNLALPPETGTTFAENARIKAIAAAWTSGINSLADDSGLEVDALGGAPGVYSARYAGADSNERANRKKLLEALRNVPLANRNARFRCVVALATPGGQVICAEGVCEGAIAFEESGDNGFGYDPLFLLPDGRTLAQYSSEEKNAVSHRANAYRAALPSLRVLLGLTKDVGT